MWQLWRQDDHGNEFHVRDFADRAVAEQARDEFIARGHHQHYWVSRAVEGPPPTGDPDSASTESR